MTVIKNNREKLINMRFLLKKLESTIPQSIEQISLYRKSLPLSLASRSSEQNMTVIKTTGKS